MVCIQRLGVTQALRACLQRGQEEERNRITVCYIEGSRTQFTDEN
jgi:hypothetical protein